jgi:hypothetical protein
MTDEAIQTLAQQVAKTLAPVFAERRRALLCELEEVAAKPTGMTRREVVHFMQERGYGVPQWVMNLS